MYDLKKLREKRQAKIDEAQGLIDAANQRAPEARSLTADEKTKYDGLDIKRAEKAEQRQKDDANKTPSLNNHNTTEARDLSKYSLLKAVRSSLPTNSGGLVLDGIEKEMHDEAVTEARSLGFSIEGVGIPQMLLSRRDNSITMPTQPEDGSVLVEKTNRPVIDLLRPKTVLRALGATYLTGLVGNVGVPTMTQGAVSSWKKEVEELSKSNQKFGTADMSPNRLGTVALRSKQFLRHAGARLGKQHRAGSRARRPERGRCRRRPPDGPFQYVGCKPDSAGCQRWCTYPRLAGDAGGCY
jgi:HK97 family phage major capsid protein